MNVYTGHPRLWAVVDRNGQLISLSHYRNLAEDEAALIAGASIVPPRILQPKVPA